MIPAPEPVTGAGARNSNPRAPARRPPTTTPHISPAPVPPLPFQRRRHSHDRHVHLPVRAHPHDAPRPLPAPVPVPRPRPRTRARPRAAGIRMTVWCCGHPHDGAPRLRSPSRGLSHNGSAPSALPPPAPPSPSRVRPATGAHTPAPVPPLLPPAPVPHTCPAPVPQARPAPGHTPARRLCSTPARRHASARPPCPTSASGARAIHPPGARPHARPVLVLHACPTSRVCPAPHARPALVLHACPALRACPTPVHTLASGVPAIRLPLAPVSHACLGPRPCLPDYLAPVPGPTPRSLRAGICPTPLRPAPRSVTARAEARRRPSREVPYGDRAFRPGIANVCTAAPRPALEPTP